MKAFRIPASAPVRFFTGGLPAAQPLILAGHVQESRKPVSVVICASMSAARNLITHTPQFQSGKDHAEKGFLHTILPPPPPDEDPDDPLPERMREELDCDRLTSLTYLANFRSNPQPHQQLLVFTTPDGLFAPAPPCEELESQELRLSAGQPYGFEELKTRLGSDLDYFAEAICERPGQFSIRGGLIDVYPLNASAPVRIDFFGDEIDSIRQFDPTSQRSLEALKEVTIAARNAGLGSSSAQSIFTYFGESVNWILIEPGELVHAHPAQFQVFENITDQRAALPTLYENRRDQQDTWCVIQELETDPLCIDPAITPT
jgi:transcription-repair coupling factor (superfamily II helicase)